MFDITWSDVAFEVVWMLYVTLCVYAGMALTEARYPGTTLLSKSMGVYPETITDRQAIVHWALVTLLLVAVGFFCLLVVTMG